MRHRQALLVVRSRQVRVAGISRTERVRSGPPVRSPGAQTSLGVDRGRDPPRPVIAIELASPARRPVLFRPRHDLQAFPSLCSVRAEGRGLEPPSAFNEIGTRPPGRWGNASRSTAPAPQSKPVTRASRLVAQITPLVAFRARGENPGRRASSRPTLLPPRALCEPHLKSLLGLIRGSGHRLIRRQRPGVARGACRPRNH